MHAQCVLHILYPSASAAKGCKLRVWHTLHSGVAGAFYKTCRALKGCTAANMRLVRGAQSATARSRGPAGQPLPKSAAVCSLHTAAATHQSAKLNHNKATTCCTN
jgi:hypothetical protein